jgi:hypothetical protein
LHNFQAQSADTDVIADLYEQRDMIQMKYDALQVDHAGLQKQLEEQVEDNNRVLNPNSLHALSDIIYIISYRELRASCGTHFEERD